MKLQPVDWMHVRIDNYYCTRVRGEVETVKLLEIGQGWFQVKVLTGEHKGEEVRALILYHAFYIGGA